MNLQIKSLTLCNFKGAKTQTIHLDGKNADIFGANATGKTTLMDAFIWLLFGKDSSDAKDFNIKTILPDGSVMHKADHYVEAVLIVDNMEQTLRRTYREKWTTKRGQVESECSSHETVYEINGVPMKAGDYSKFVAGIINEAIFKVITNPVYFNERLKWQDRRELLIKLAGNIDTTQIEKDHVEILRAMNGAKLADFKTQIAALKKKVKDEKVQCQPRISEQRMSLPADQDWAVIEHEIATLTQEVAEIDQILQQSSKGSQKAIDDRQKLMVRKADNNRKISKYQMDVQADLDDQSRRHQSRISAAKDEINTLQNKINSIKNAEESYKKQIEMMQANIERLNSNIAKCREEWKSVNSQTFVFDENLTVCPACKQKLPDSDIESRRTHLEANFIAEKKSLLDETVKTANGYKESIAKLTETIATLKKQSEELEDASMIESIIEEKKEALNALMHTPVVVENFRSLPEVWALMEDNATIDEELSKPLCVEGYDPQRIADLNATKASKQEQIKAKHILLSSRELREKGLNRIAEIAKREKELAQEIARLEGLEFAIMDYTKASIANIENAINRKFKMVRFKMFDTQLNGGETECCETIVNGVPWSDLNTASRINAGLDIINAFSQYYDTYAPIFIDNRESVTELLPMQSQVISLIVSPENKSLKIQTI